MKKILCVLFAAAVTATAFTGCKKLGDEEDTISYSDSESAVDSDAESSVDQTVSETASAEDVADWTNLTFGMDSVYYKTGFAASDLFNSGWTFNPTIYGLDNCILNPGIMLSCDVYLSNENFDDGVVAVGFGNYSDADTDIFNSNIWSIKIDIKDKTNYPEFAIPGNIEWNVSDSEIKAVLGEASSSERDEEAECTELVYTVDNSTVHYFVYDDGGMQKFWLEGF